MSQRRPIDVVRSLRETRRSMGDGTVGGRTRLSTPRTSSGGLLSGNPRRGGSDVTDPGGASAQHRSTIRTFQATDLDVSDAGWVKITYDAEIEDAGSVGMPNSDLDEGEWVADQHGTYLARLVLVADTDPFDEVQVRLMLNGDEVKGPNVEVGWTYSGDRLDVAETVMCETGDTVWWEVYVPADPEE